MPTRPEPPLSQVVADFGNDQALVAKQDLARSHPDSQTQYYQNLLCRDPRSKISLALSLPFPFVPSSSAH